MSSVSDAFHFGGVVRARRQLGQVLNARRDLGRGILRIAKQDLPHNGLLQLLQATRPKEASEHWFWRIRMDHIRSLTLASLDWTRSGDPKRDTHVSGQLCGQQTQTCVAAALAQKQHRKTKDHKQ
jgi:hypothetical protein